MILLYSQINLTLCLHAQQLLFKVLYAQELFCCLLPYASSHCVHGRYDAINIHLSQIFRYTIVIVNVVRLFYLPVRTYQFSSSPCGYNFCETFLCSLLMYVRSLSSFLALIYTDSL